MAQDLRKKREQIQISDGRTMNIYTFELDGAPMSEMTRGEVVETTSEEQTQPAQG